MSRRVLRSASAGALTASFPEANGPARLRINALAVNRVARRAYEKAGFTPYEVMYERRLSPARS